MMYHTTSSLDNRPIIAYIDQIDMMRECVLRCLQTDFTDAHICGFATFADLLDSPEKASVRMIMYCNSGQYDARMIHAFLRQALQFFPDIPVIIISSECDRTRVVDAVRRGAGGFIFTTANLDLAIGVMHVVWNGGSFIPASCVAALTPAEAQRTADVRPTPAFTPRQIAVLKRLRQGKANRTIAEELKMSESTVKAHVRNLMQRLHATNRTQVVYLTKEMLPLAAEENDPQSS